MKSNFKKIPGSQIILEVTLENAEFLPYYKTAYDKALARVQVKGFRPGSAPQELADQGVDKETVFSDAAKEAIRWSLDEVSKDKEWTLIDAPRIEVEDAKDGIKYKATLTVFPELKLGNYQKIAKKVLGEKKEMKVEAGEVEKTLEWLRQSRKPRRTNPSKNNEVGAPTGTPTVPSGNASEENDKVPELNDEFAKTVGKFQTVEELKKSVSEGVLMEKQYREKERLRLKMLEEIIKASEIDLPLIMVEKTEANMAKQLGPMLKASGKTDEQIHKELHERAGHNVASNLVIYKIAQDEKLEPTKEEVGEGGDYNYNYGVLLNEKVYSFLEK